MRIQVCASLIALLVLGGLRPFATYAQDRDGVHKQTLTVAGSVWNGVNGGPESSITVRLYRDTGGGDRVVRSERFAGASDASRPRASGNFVLSVNCVRAFYTLEVLGFLEDGAEAVGVAWWLGGARGQQTRLLKRETGEPGPWTYSWYEVCDGGHKDSIVYQNLTLEYSSAHGGRGNASWMYVAGRVYDSGIPAGMVYDHCGNQVYAWRDVDPYQAVPGVTVFVERIGFTEDRNDQNIVHPQIVRARHACVTGDRGFWGIGLSRRPGFYRVRVDETTLPDGDAVEPARIVSHNPLFFQVFDLYSSGGATNHYGIGSAWLPWNAQRSEWVYDNLIFEARNTWSRSGYTAPACP